MKNEEVTLPQPHRADPLLFVVVLLLVGLGLVMVYSSSAVLAQQKWGQSLFPRPRSGLGAARARRNGADDADRLFALSAARVSDLGTATLLLSAVLVVGRVSMVPVAGSTSDRCHFNPPSWPRSR